MTNPITPQEARDALDESNPGPWKIEEYDGCPEAAATFSAAGFTEYGVHIKFPDWQFMSPVLGDRGVWTTDKALAEHNLSVLRGNSQFCDANIRLVARRVSPTWEVRE